MDQDEAPSLETLRFSTANREKAMSFDALTFAGLFSAVITGGFMIALATRAGVSQVRGRKHTSAH